MRRSFLYLHLPSRCIHIGARLSPAIGACLSPSPCSRCTRNPRPRMVRLCCAHHCTRNPRLRMEWLCCAVRCSQNPRPRMATTARQNHMLSGGDRWLVASESGTQKNRNERDLPLGSMTCRKNPMRCNMAHRTVFATWDLNFCVWHPNFHSETGVICLPVPQRYCACPCRAD